MAILHVSVSGSSTSPYETWAKASTDIDTIDSIAAAGDTVYISHVFDSGYVATTTLDFSNGTRANPVTIFSSDETTGSPIDGDAGNYAAGALISTTTGVLAINGHIRTWGMAVTTLGTTADITLNAGTDARHIWTEAVITNADKLNICVGTRTSVVFLYSSFTRGSALGEGITVQGAGSDSLYSNCTFTKSSGEDNLVKSIGGSGQYITFLGCNVSDFGTILSGSFGSGFLLLRGCEVSSGVVLTAQTVTGEGIIALEACSNGTITIPELGITEFETFYGTVKSSTSRFRTSGADDGEQANAHSWEMVSNTNDLEFVNALVGPPIVVWDDGGVEKTFKIFVASGVTYQDDELWIELQGPAKATSTATRYVERSNDATAGSVPMNPRDTPVNLTTDAVSAWNGTGVGTKQELAITYTPGIAGPVTIRVFLAKASSTVYIDPKIDVS